MVNFLEAASGLEPPLRAMQAPALTFLATPPQLFRARWCPYYDAMPGPSNRLVVCCPQYPHLNLDAVNLSLNTEGGWYAPAIRASPGASGRGVGGRMPLCLLQTGSASHLFPCM